MSDAADGLQPLAGVTAGSVEEGQLYRATLPNGTALVVGRYAGTFFGHKDYCPHADFPLSEGTLYANGEIECCWHGARFQCRSGARISGPADQGLVTFEVVEREGTLFARRAATGSEGGQT